MEERRARRWVNVVRTGLGLGAEGCGGGQGEDRRCASRVNSITRVLSGYFSTAATHNLTAARAMAGMDWWFRRCESYTLRKCSSSAANLVLRPLGQGGKMFLLHLLEDVVKSPPRRPGAAFMKQ